MKYKKFLILILALVGLCSLFAACGDDKTEEDKLVEQGYAFKVIFDCNGGKSDVYDTRYALVLSNGKSPVGEPGKISVAAPVLEDYSLVGWFLGEKNADGAVTFGEQWSFKSFVKGNMTLYAKWSRNYNYRIVADGKTVYTKQCKPGDPFDVGFEFKRPGYTFLEYYSDESLTAKWNPAYAHPGYTGSSADPDSDPTGHDVTVFAKYLTGEYTKATRASDFSKLSQSSNYYLIGDGNKEIDFTGFAWPELYMYSGEIIGNGVTLKNLTFEVKNSSRVGIDGGLGLFGNLLNSKISDVTFKDCTVKIVYTEPLKFNAIFGVGFFGGKAKGASLTNVVLENCALDVSIKSTVTTVFPTPDDDKYLWGFSEDDAANGNVSGVTGTIEYRYART